MNTYDIETFEEKEKVIPYCIAFNLNNENFYIYYKNEEDLILSSINIIITKSKKIETTFYIHNLNFDGMLIIESLTKNKINFKMYNRELNIYSIILEFMDNKIIFKCSYKILPSSLDNLTNLLSKKKKIFPYKFSNKENLFYIGNCPNIEYFKNIEEFDLFNKKEIFDFKKESIDYCLNDVIILKELLEDIINTLKKINKNFINYFLKSNSSPSFSYKIYFKFFNKFNIKEKINLELYEYIKLSYFGGRCEIFGNPYDYEKIKYYDFSGMYAQCMLEIFPYGEYEIVLNPNNLNNIGFYYITCISNLEYPILPTKDNNKLMFKNGIIEGLFWYEEINLFLEKGGVLKNIKYGIIFNKSGKIFEDFINQFTKIKNMGGYYKILGKLIINSLYGGFGMSKIENFTYITFSEIEFNNILEKTDIKSYSKLNSCYIIEIEKNYKSNFLFNKEQKKWNLDFHDRNIIYSSIIASKARIKLYKKFEEVIKDNGRLLYCDTDSIFAAYSSDESNLEWLDIYDKACFILPKFYILKKKNIWETKIKGVNNYFLDPEKIINDFYQNNEKILIKDQLQFYKKKYNLKQKYNVKLIWLNKYDKREFIDNKKKTKPLNYTHTINDF